MSIASHIFGGTAEEASLNNGLADGPADRRAEFYRVTDIGLKPLYRVIAGEDCPKFQPVAMSDGFEQITFGFPPVFVERLALLKEAQFDEVIPKWRESEDVPYDNEADLRDLLTALVRLAAQAQKSRLNLYLWNAL